MVTYRCLVVADDLTGAADTGNEFAKRGHPTIVSVGTDPDNTLDEIGDKPVLVANTESRYSPREEARETVERVTEATDAAVVYKKVDSTLRGNVAAEVAGALDAANADVALVAPAFPANGRVTACGYHLVDGTLVAETAAGRDPEKPVPTSLLPELLSGIDYPTESLSIDRVARGAESVSDALRNVASAASSPTVVVCDAIHDDHLRTIADGAASSRLDVVYVGSAGLAKHVSLATATRTATVEDGTKSVGGKAADTTTGYALGIVGSTNPQTLSQLRAVPERRRVSLDPETAVRDPERAATRAVRRLREAVGDGSIGVVTSAQSGEDVDAALAAGASEGIEEGEVRSRVARALSMAAAKAWTSDGRTPCGLFLTGGAIAIEVLTALSASGIRLTGDSAETGIPIGSVVGGVADGTPVITKAGAFGAERAIVNGLVRLGGQDDPV